MILKVFLVVLATSLAITAASDPRRFFKPLNEIESEKNVEITPFVDPVDGISYRLPNDTIPLHYDVTITTDIHRGILEFTGEARITFKVLNQTNKVVLHHRFLTIYNATILRDTGTVLQSDPLMEYDDDREFLSFSTTRFPLAEGATYILVINYIGSLRDDEAGFYHSSYVDTEGNRKWLAVTQFESTDARHGFPCFDEPGIRSTFAITIRHHYTYSAVSNMPVKSSDRESGSDYVITVFETTPPVQSYLIAYMISDFKFVEDARPIPQRVYAKPQSIDNDEAEVAINVSGPLLEVFVEYLGVNYSLPKMDQAAIPDFDAGAMENWGLVTYREQYLLFNKETGTTRDKENIEATIAHEFAHQHFGNLVAPAFWHYLWLNEGFATLYENYMLHLLYPDGRWMDSFQVDTFIWVMESDSNPNVRAMTYYVERPAGIERLFDNVAYSKSGTVLRMFQNAFGGSTWAKGLHNYLTTMQYKSATSADLYAGLQTAVSEDSELTSVNVAQVMGSWELQSGFPYVHVTREGNSLVLEQNRFLYNDRNSENLWWIPISYRVVGEAQVDHSTTADTWIAGTKRRTIDGSTAPRPFTSSDLIVINYQQSGYYRVNYDTELWNEFIDVINNPETLSQIHLLNRVQLIDDSFHLARANLLNFNVMMGLMNYLEQETDYLPWVAVNRVNTLISRWLTGSEIFAHYEEFMRKNVQALFLRLGVDIIENEPRVDRYARTIAMNIACSMSHPVCLEQTLNELISFLDSEITLHPDVSSGIYCNGMRTASMETYMKLLQKALDSTSQSERNSIFSSIGCSRNFAVIDNFMNFALESSILTTAERQRILLSTINNGEEAVESMISLIFNSYERLNAIGLLSTLLSNVADRIFNENMKNAFLTDIDMYLGLDMISSASHAALEQRADTILQWQQNNLNDFKSFFEVPTEPPTESTTTETSTVTQSTTTQIGQDTTTIQQESTTSETTTSAGEETTSSSVQPTSTSAPMTTTAGSTSAQTSIIVLLISFVVKMMI